MRRYIDADLMKYCLKKTSLDRGRLNLFCRLLDETPTADVAPRADVAREIFAEIDRQLSVDENGFNAIAEEGLSEGHAYCETYVHNLRAHLAELKKKYESEGAG